MTKLHINKKGFSAVEGILVLVIVVLICVVGYMVNKNHHKTITPSKPVLTTADNIYSGWQSYGSNQVSFKYPHGWSTASGPASNEWASNSVVAYMTSAPFNSATVDTPLNPGASIQLYLQLSTDSSTIDCTDAPCKVSAVIPLNNLHLPEAELALVNQTSGNGTKFTEYVVAANPKVGDTNIKAVGGIYIFGQPEYNTNGQGVTEKEAAQVINATAFQSNNQLKELVELINSIKFK